MVRLFSALFFFLFSKTHGPQQCGLKLINNKRNRKQTKNGLYHCYSYSTPHRGLFYFLISLIYFYLLRMTSLSLSLFSHYCQIETLSLCLCSLIFFSLYCSLSHVTPNLPKHGFVDKTTSYPLELGT